MKSVFQASGCVEQNKVPEIESRPPPANNTTCLLRVLNTPEYLFFGYVQYDEWERGPIKKKSAQQNRLLRRFLKKVLRFFKAFIGLRRKRATTFSALRRKMFRHKNRVLRWAHPASRRLLRKTAVLTQTLRPRSSATASQCPGAHISNIRADC